jgi:sulfoxide reductase heme-binding subunit YedZ
VPFTRASGVVAQVLLTAVVVLGLLGPLRVSAPPRWPRFAVDTLHRDLSLIAVVVLLIHILTTVLDTFTSINITAAVIPFVSNYRPLWLGLGTVAFDLMLALIVTSLLRRRLGLRAWRAVHWFAYVCWPIAILHGLGSGSDAKQVWSILLTAACVIVVMIALLTRLGAADERYRGPAIVATLLVPLAIAAFALAGPLQHGWARRAGTPSTLLLPKLVAARGGPAVSGTTTKRRATLKLPFSAHLAGTVKQTTVAGGAIVDLALRLSAGAHGRLRVRLGGAPDQGGGLSMTGSQVVLAADGLPSVMVGTISSLVGQQFVAQVHGGGATVNLNVQLSIDQVGGTATGVMAAKKG